MTGQAGGDESAATIEVRLLGALSYCALARGSPSPPSPPPTLTQVMLGNLLGTFLSPALLGMFMSGPWAFGKPVAEGGGGNARIYEEVIKQVCCAASVRIEGRGEREADS